MFTSSFLPAFVAGRGPSKPPEDVPPPTPIHFPCYRPQVREDDDTSAPPAEESSGGTAAVAAQAQQQQQVPLTKLLQGIVRPTEVAERHFEALGVHVIPDVAPEELVPDRSVLPDFAAWEAMTYEQAGDANQSTRVRISNGNLSPGVQAYHDRRRELSTANEPAYRAVRRLAPVPGQPQARLGNSYEFFRFLDAFTTFWDDTSQPPPPPPPPKPSQDSANSGVDAADKEEGEGQEKGAETEGADGETKDKGDDETKKAAESESEVGARFFRSGAGTNMPPEFRHNITTSFVKLVAYDFGCNVCNARVEPRLYLNAPTVPASEEAKPLASPQPPTSQPSTSPSSPAGVASPTTAGTGAEIASSLSPSTGNRPSPKPRGGAGRSSYFTSGCTFIFRTPTTREAARAGIVEGPVAAVSARHTTSFAPPQPGAATGVPDKDSIVDLAREIVAALLTAQHRAREGRAERRIGEDSWWATKRRWGGGEGGPIGREVDMGATAPPPASGTPPAEGIGSAPPPPSSSSSGGIRSRTGGPGGSGLSLLSSKYGRRSQHSQDRDKDTDKGPKPKSRRTTLAIYDNYRMVRPPSSSWDKKTRYMAIGRAPGTAHDDIFVVSALFHHVAVLRVRVPQRLLNELDGSATAAAAGKPHLRPSRGWGRVEVRRSRWFDLFVPDDRLEALRAIWAMMAYTMRRIEDPAAGASSPSAAAGATAFAPAAAAARTAAGTDVKMGGT